jgi:hypothetical protein
MRQLAILNCALDNHYHSYEGLFTVSLIVLGGRRIVLSMAWHGNQAVYCRLM